MRTSSLGVILFVFLLTSSSAMAGKPGGSAYLDGEDAKVGVILCHGRGQYPTWLVVDPLRKGIHKELGYHTLSLQMPAENKNWREYAEDFPEAYQRIQAVIDFLRKEKGVEKVYLMGHSMGSRMATAFLAERPNSGVAGFIGVGVRNGGDDPLDSDANLRVVSLPVLDVYGDGGNGKDADHASDRSEMVSDRYKQVLISGANHKFTAHEDELVKVVVNWLRGQR